MFYFICDLYDKIYLWITLHWLALRSLEQRMSENKSSMRRNNMAETMLQYILIMLKMISYNSEYTLFKNGDDRVISIIFFA